MERTVKLKICMPREDLEALRLLAQVKGLTLSGLLRKRALRGPARHPERRRIAGTAAMDAAGALLGRSLRKEVPEQEEPLLRQLHACIMALEVETTRDAPPPAELKHGNGEPRVKDAEKMLRIDFRVSPAEAQTILSLAALYGLPLSTYVRRRALGKALRQARQPVEGLAAVRRCTALLGYAARNGTDCKDAEKLYLEARRKCLELEGAVQ